jgi:hypothetical protein
MFAWWRKVEITVRFRLDEGGIAQLGERLHGMQEVSGSIPLTSTKATRFKPLTSSAKRFNVPFV